MRAAHPELASLAKGFRERYLSYEALTAQVRAWADAFPDLVELSSIGKSREGRELWLLTIGPDPVRVRPAVWVDGNMHASELAGSSVALAIAEEAIAIHLGAREDDESAVTAAAKDVLFYVLPRMSPDGAEAVLKNGRYVRSVPRDERPDRARPRWVAGDIDGDGAARVMRKRDPAGDFVPHPRIAGLMLPRRIEDEGPFYKLYPEGHIEGFDGHHVPDPDYLSDNFPDLNRNFPWEWRGEPGQKGAGTHPGSEPESRAVIETATRLPNLFAWLNLHTFGGVMIRPPGDVPDGKMNQLDLAIYRQLEEWCTGICGYPMVSGYEEFLYHPDEPVRGTLSEWAYVERGCLAWVTELWDIFARIGMQRPKRFVEHYSRMTRSDVESLARWDEEQNAGRIFRAFAPTVHDQLGEVEVGGPDPRVGLSNPSYEALPAICEQHARLFLRVAAMVPRVMVSRVRTERLGEGVTLLEADIDNQGYLATHGVHAAEDKPWNEPLWADLGCEGELAHVDPSQAHRPIGHLAGWGRGRFGFGHAIFFQRSRGSGSHRRTLNWILRGRGVAHITVGSCRIGRVEHDVAIE